MTAGTLESAAQSLESNVDAYEAYLKRSTTEAIQAWQAIVAAAESEVRGDVENEESTPLVWKLYGNSKLHTPPAYGGDVEEAIEAYERSLALYETVPARTISNWLFIDTMAFLGQAYVKAGQKPKAVAVYEKALKAEPAFAWVKYGLLPAAQSDAR